MFAIYDGTTQIETTANVQTARVIAQREANQRGHAVWYNEVGTRQTFTVKPEVRP